jgi:hypothetical protein
MEAEADIDAIRRGARSGITGGTAMTPAPMSSVPATGPMPGSTTMQ